MGADQRLVATFEKSTDGVDLATVFARGVTEVPFRLHCPVRPETIFAQRLVVGARAERLLGHDDDRLRGHTTEVSISTVLSFSLNGMVLSVAKNTDVGRKASWLS